MAKTPIELGALARSHCMTAIQVCRGIMNNDKTPPQVKLQAASIIMDRGLGKPAQALTVEAQHTHTLALDNDELTRRLASMLYRADQLTGPVIDITPVESST